MAKCKYEISKQVTLDSNPRYQLKKRSQHWCKSLCTLNVFSFGPIWRGFRMVEIFRFRNTDGDLSAQKKLNEVIICQGESCKLPFQGRCWMIARDSIASASSVGFLAGCWLYQGIQWRMPFAEISSSDHSFVICLVFPTNRPLRVSRIIILSHWAISHSYRYSYVMQLYVVQNCSPNRGLKTRNWSQIRIPCGNVSELTKIFPTHPHTTISSYSPCQLVDSRNGKSWNVWYILPQTTWTRTTRISWSQRKDESFPRKWVGENATSLLDSIFPQRNGLVRQLIAIPAQLKVQCTIQQETFIVFDWNFWYL